MRCGRLRANWREVTPLVTFLYWNMSLGDFGLGCHEGSVDEVSHLRGVTGLQSIGSAGCDTSSSSWRGFLGGFLIAHRGGAQGSSSRWSVSGSLGGKLARSKGLKSKLHFACNESDRLSMRFLSA